MCNEFQQRIAWEAYLDLMASLDIGVPMIQTELDLPAADSIRITEPAAVLRVAGNGMALSPAKFGFPPRGKGGPVFNFRSEGREFRDSERCLIPMSAFYEYKGTKSPKAKYQFTPKEDQWMAIAGLWKTIGGQDFFTMLTTDPGPDIEPIHDRQIVVVTPKRFGDWLYDANGELLAPAPAGTFDVELIRRGKDWPPEGELF